MSLRSLRELFLYRVRTFAREPAVLFWLFLVPVLAMAALGLAFRPGASGRLPVAVTGDRSSQLGEALAKSAELAPRVVSNEALADRALARGEVLLVVVAGEPPRYRFDPTRTESLLARLLVDRALALDRGQADPIGARLEPVSCRGCRYVDFFVPGLVGMVIMNTMLLGTGVSLVSMRAQGLLKRFAATPLPRWQLLAAQVASRLVFTTLMAALLFVVARIAFDVELQGRAIDLGVIVVLGGLSFSGIALAVAARTKNVETAQGIVTVIGLPMILFSGVFYSDTGFPFSTTGMPEWLRAPASFLPLTLLNDALRAVVNEGASLASMPARLALLVAWGALPFAFAARTFRWT